MPDMADVLEIEAEGKVKPKRRFDARDWSFIVEYVISEHERRKTARADRERHWKEIDRQIAMEPDLAFKKLPSGQLDVKKVWMAEMELPLQAQALEVLTADADRMLFPDAGPWFRAHAEMTDEYLRGADFQAVVQGDEAEVPSAINQDNADKLVEGYLLHLFRQYDLRTRMKRVNAESFKYGMGVARARMETKNVYIHEARGVRKETQKIPVLVPVSIKNLYLDTPMASMHSAQMFGDAHIAEDWIKLENLQVAANKGSNDPSNPEGGWMPKNIKGMVADRDGYIHILELEGDIVVPRETVRSVVIPGAIVTVAVGGAMPGGEVSRAVVRFRFRKHPFSSYLLFPYHYEDVTNPYPASPLMKGRPLQIMAVDALNRLMDAGALKNAPPISYDKTDQHFAATGGPEVFPTAMWGSSDPNSIKAHMEIGGDQAALASVLTLGLNFYAELTGVLPGRVGAQTVSHTTAFAKDAELQRGATRTVSYARQIGNGPIARWLDMAYRMGRETIGRDPVSFFIDAYGGFVEVPKDMLPERAIFEWFGAGGPSEEAQKKQMKLEALMMAFKIDQVDLPMGGKPVLNKGAAIEQILREAGWTDVDFLTVDTAPAQAPESPAIAQAAIQQLMAPPKAA